MALPARGISDSVSAEGRKGPSSVYAATVVGLTVLMACLVLAPEPIETYTAEAVVRFTGAKGTSEGEALVSSAELADWSREARSTQESALECAIEQSSPASVAVRLFATNARSAFAVSDVTEAIDGLSTEIPNAAAERLASAKGAIQRRFETAEQHWSELQTKLDRLTRERTEDLIESTRQMALTKQQPPPAQVETPEDPQRVRLEKAVAERQSHLAELLRTQTDMHPQVIEAKERLHEAQSALAALPTRRAPEIVKEEPATESPAANVRNSELVAARERINKQLEGAETERLHWRKELAAAAERERSGKVAVAVVAPPQIVARQGGTPSATRIMGYLLLSIAGAMAMYGFAEKSERARRMSTVDEVESTISLPVTMVLPGMRRMDGEEAPQLRHVLGRATSACEAGLALAAVVLLVASLFGQSLTVAPTQDPLGALAEAIDRTLDSVRR